MRLDNLLFEGQNYTLDWAEVMPLSSTDTLKGVLPSSDFAIYLINSVKFHCGCDCRHLSHGSLPLHCEDESAFSRLRTREHCY